MSGVIPGRKIAKRNKPRIYYKNNSPQMSYYKYCFGCF